MNLRIFLAVSCGNPPELSNGSFDISEGTSYKCSAKYTCDKGYKLYGYNSISCQADGIWSLLTAECKSQYFNESAHIKMIKLLICILYVCSCTLGIQCEELFNITNGKLSSNGRGYGSTTSFSCDEGYRLVGINASTCDDSGFWSPAPPICQS